MKKLLLLFLAALLALALVACGSPETPETPADPVDPSLKNFEGLTLADKTVTYNGTEHEILVGGTLPEGATDSPVLEVRRRAIEVTAASETRIYDGTPLKNDTAYLSKGSLISGHRLVVTTVGTCNTVGTIINRVASVIILDRNDNDVTRLYNVTKQNGALTLLAPPEE